MSSPPNALIQAIITACFYSKGALMGFVKMWYLYQPLKINRIKENGSALYCKNRKIGFNVLVLNP